MANTIQIKRGAASGLPSLAAGEPGFTTDTFRLYVGSAGGNKLVGEADFVKLSGSTMTGALTLSGSPSSDLHAATKAYVDAARTGLYVKAACRLATAAALPAHGAISGNVITASANGALTVDGVAAALNDRILVKDEGSGTHLENGIYYLSQLGDASHPWKLTRVDDANSNDEVKSGMFVFVSEGTANSDSGYVLTTNDPITLNTTALTFGQFSGAGQITAGTGLTKTGNTLNVVGTTDRITANADSIDIASTYVGQSSITTLGTIATGTWNATAIAANKGGTGQTGYTTGDLLYASSSSALSKLADVAAGSFLRSGGVGAAPAWSTLVLPNSATAGDILYASAANTMATLAKGTAYKSLNMNSGATAPTYMDSLQSLMTTTGDIVQASAANTPARLAAVATGNVLISGGVGTVSSWGKVGLTTHISGTLGAANGGTGVANNAANTITFTGNYSLGITLSGATSVTFPTSGTLATTSHTHGNITSDGKIGTTATIPIITGTGGILQAGSFGSSAGTFCQGNDARLSDARTPTAHNLIDTTGHPVSGLTTGHFLKATGATTYAFAAHGLTYSDVGAAPTSHATNGSTYGYGDGTNAGHLRVGTGIGVSSGTISVTYGSSSGTACQGNDSRLHSQNTDTGTTSATFQLDSGNSGPKLKNESGAVAIVNAAANAYANLKAATLQVGVSGGMTIAVKAGGSMAFYNPGDTNYAVLAFEGNANRTFVLPNDAGTSLISNASVVDGGTW
jgi:hypothetical protein